MIIIISCNCENTDLIELMINPQGAQIMEEGEGMRRREREGERETEEGGAFKLQL